jgi:hypothetical protein
MITEEALVATLRAAVISSVLRSKNYRLRRVLAQVCWVMVKRNTPTLSLPQRAGLYPHLTPRVLHRGGRDEMSDAVGPPYVAADCPGIGMCFPGLYSIKP